MAAIGVLDTVSIDANNPQRLAAFYSRVLDLQVVRVGEDYAQLAPFAVGGPSLLFLQVPEEKLAKNRLHLDLAVADVARATELCEAQGAARVTEGVLAGPFRWQVMLDPEGNEFCLCPSE